MNQISIENFFSYSKAYFIAVDKYVSPAVTDLQTPCNDVKILSTVLHQLHGFAIEPLAYKTDDGFDASMPNPLLNPRSGQLLHFLRNLTASENDRVLLYFACHGIAIDSEGNPEGYLLAADATPGQWDSFIKMSEVLEILNELNCKHLLLILDCCYAGAFRWAGTTRGIGAEVPKTIYYEKLKQYTDNKAWQVLTSAAHDQKAIDTLRLGKRETEGGSFLSPFAELLVKALQTGDADLSFGSMEPDGLITATELNYYLQQSIFKSLFDQRIEADKRQLPMLFPVINAAVGLVGKGEFLFKNPSIQNIQLKSKININPYKGLDAYTKEDNTIFYGRQRVLTGWIDGKTENIGLIPASEQFQVIILTGPSGIGKSSLAKAGLLAYYNGSAEKKSAAVKKIYELRPGKTPWSTNEMVLHEIRSLETAIVLVDQYEELVTICASGEEREKFENELVLTSQKNVVIVTIRSDFENQFKSSPLLQIQLEEDKIRKHRFVVPPFERDELEEIVLQPAMQELLEFKPINNIANASDAFVNRIVDDAFQNPGSLPLLSMALSELWEKRDNNNLLEQTYQHFGGIIGILDRKANEEFNKLSNDAESRLLFKQLIFRMVSFEGGRISRRRIYTVLTVNSNGNVLDEMILNTPSRTEKIKEIAENLRKARLIKSDIDESGNSFIEPSHDALLRSWIMLTQWLKEKDVRTNQTGQETIVLLRSVFDAVNNRVLWASDPRLPVAKKNIGVNLNQSEEKFIKDSIRKKNYHKRIRGWSIGIAASIITALGIFGWVQAVRSDTRAKRNQALYLASESDKYTPSDAIRLLEQAHKLDSTQNIVHQKIADLFSKSDYEISFAFRRIALANSILDYSPLQNGVLIRNLNNILSVLNSSGRLIKQFPGSGPFKVSPDQQYFTFNTVSGSKTLVDAKGMIVWEAKNSDNLVPYFSPDSKYLLLLSVDGEIVPRLKKVLVLHIESKVSWNITIRENISIFVPDINEKIFFLPERKMLLIYGSINQVYNTYLYDTAGRIVQKLNGDLITVNRNAKKVVLRKGKHYEIINYLNDDQLPAVLKTPFYSESGFLSDNGNTLVLLQRGSYYAWDLQKPHKCILNNFFVTNTDIDNNYLSGNGKLLTIFNHDSIINIDLFLGNQAKIRNEISDPNKNNPTITRCASGNKFLLYNDVSASFFDADEGILKPFSKNNFFPRFANVSGKTLAFLSGEKDVVYWADAEQFGSDVLHYSSVKGNFATYLLSEDAKLVFLNHKLREATSLSLDNNKKSGNSGWKELAGALAMYRGYLNWYRKTDSGIIFYTGFRDSSVYSFKTIAPDHNFTDGVRIFYSFRKMKAIIADNEDNLWYTNLQTKKIVSVKFNGHLFNTYFDDDGFLLTGFTKYAAYNFTGKEIENGNINIADLSHISYNEEFNDNTILDFNNDTLRYRFIQGKKIWHRTFQNRHIEFAAYNSGRYITVRTINPVNSADIETLLLDLEGKIMCNLSGPDNTNLVFDEERGKLFYLKNEKLCVRYDYKNILKNLDKNGVHMLDDQLKKRFYFE